MFSHQVFQNGSELYHFLRRPGRLFEFRLAEQEGRSIREHLYLRRVGEEGYVVVLCGTEPIH